MRAKNNHNDDERNRATWGSVCFVSITENKGRKSFFENPINLSGFHSHDFVVEVDCRGPHEAEISNCYLHKLACTPITNA